jgi:hypothetical protein
VVSSDHLLPGATGQIKASVHTAGRLGQMTKHITVFSNDRSNPVLSFTLSLQVVAQ